MTVRRRAVQRQDRVVQRRARAPKTSLKPADLRNPQFDHASLGQKTYLSIPELTQYLSFPTENAAHHWLAGAAIVKCRRGRTVLVLRLDVDEVVQQARQAVHCSPSLMKKGA